MKTKTRTGQLAPIPYGSPITKFQHYSYQNLNNPFVKRLEKINYQNFVARPK